MPMSSMAASSGSSAFPLGPVEARIGTSSSSSPIFTPIVTIRSLRHTSTGTRLPMSVSATMRGSSRMVSTGLPSNFRMTSPASMPLSSAGPSSVTDDTSAPRAPPSRPMLSAISSVTDWMRTPSQPRRVCPKSRSWSMTRAAMDDGMAKPTPTLPPVGEKMAVFTPITSPLMLNIGPPELPRLMDASVCRKLSYGPWRISRWRAEMMPAVTVPPRPNGLPIATTQSPTRAPVESPQGTNGRSRSVSTFSNARSVLGSRPRSSALSWVSSDRVTVISSAPSIT